MLDIILLALSSSTDHISGDSVEEVCALLTGTREEVEERCVISQGNRTKVTSTASQLDIAIEHFCKSNTCLQSEQWRMRMYTELSTFVLPSIAYISMHTLYTPIQSLAAPTKHTFELVGTCEHRVLSQHFREPAQCDGGCLLVRHSIR